MGFFSICREHLKTFLNIQITMPEPKQYPEAFGPNAWLIEEMYRQFREQPQTLTESGRDFLSSDFTN